jgi:hypothetical protein
MCGGKWRKLATRAADLILEIDVRERLSIVVTHDETGVLFLD